MFQTFYVLVMLQNPQNKTTRDFFIVNPRAAA